MIDGGDVLNSLERDKFSLCATGSILLAQNDVLACGGKGGAESFSSPNKCVPLMYDAIGGNQGSGLGDDDLPQGRRNSQGRGE